MITETSLASRIPADASANRGTGGNLSARMRSRRAFTLVEVMAATIIFAGSILGVYAMMIRAYQMVTFARYRDNARAIVSAFADQFQRLQTTDANPSGGTPILRTMFYADGVPTGTGLTWTNSAGTTVTGTTSGLAVKLGDASSGYIDAVVTREVHYLNSSSGITQTGNTASAAGWLLQATFTITYRVNSYPQTVQLTIARSVR